MKIILFIGHHKVGSSALQDYLSAHALALLRQGVLYPAVEGQGMALLLRRALSGETPEPLPPNLREAHNALAFRMIAEHNGSAVPALHPGLPPAADMLRMIQRQVEVFEPRVMILAAEVFSHFANLSTDMIAELAGAFPGAEIALTATLRRVDDYLVSWHGQRLRFGHQVRALPQGALAHYVKTIHFDYRLMLEGWTETLPEASLRLRPYDAVMAAGGSVQDFMTGFDLPLPAPPGAAPVNAGLHRGLIEIARQANAALEPEDAADLFRVLLRLGPALDLPPSSGIELYGAAARARMAARFAPINDWLSERAGAPFFADAARIAELRPHPEIAANRAALAQLTGAHRAAFAPAAQAFLDGLEPAPNYS